MEGEIFEKVANGGWGRGPPWRRSWMARTFDFSQKAGHTICVRKQIECPLLEHCVDSKRVACSICPTKSGNIGCHPKHSINWPPVIQSETLHPQSNQINLHMQMSWLRGAIPFRQSRMWGWIARWRKWKPPERPVVAAAAAAAGGDRPEEAANGANDNSCDIPWNKGPNRADSCPVPHSGKPFTCQCHQNVPVRSDRHNSAENSVQKQLAREQTSWLHLHSNVWSWWLCGRQQSSVFSCSRAGQEGGGQGGAGGPKEGPWAQKNRSRMGKPLQRALCWKNLSPKLKAAEAPPRPISAFQRGAQEAKEQKIKTVFFFLSLSGRCRAIQLLDTNRKKNRSSADVGAA